MLLECYILLAWIALLSVALVAFTIAKTLRSYHVVARASRDMNIMFLECYILIAWVILLLVGLVAFIHGF